MFEECDSLIDSTSRLKPPADSNARFDLVWAVRFRATAIHEE